MCLLNTCAAILTFMIDYDAPGVRWMCSYAICKRIKIWLCKQIFKCENILHDFSACRPFSFPQKEYKMVLEWKISNLKLAWEEDVKVFLKWWVQLCIAKFAIYY